MKLGRSGKQGRIRSKQTNSRRPVSGGAQIVNDRGIYVQGLNDVMTLGINQFALQAVTGIKRSNCLRCK